MNKPEKSYQTTTIRQLKSYPTYQFHAFSNAKCSPEDTFLICVLETLKWLHARMKNCEQLPEELNVPLPEDYQTFDRSKLHSFSIDLGFQIEVVYIQKKESGRFGLLKLMPVQIWEHQPNESQYRAEPSAQKSLIICIKTVWKSGFGQSVLNRLTQQKTAKCSVRHWSKPLHRIPM